MPEEDGSNGRLSERFDEPNNLWMVLWDATLPMAASQQRSLQEDSRDRRSQAHSSQKSAGLTASQALSGDQSGGWGWNVLGGVAAVATGLVAESAGGLKQLAADVGNVASVAGRDVVCVAAAVGEMVASDAREAAESSAAISAITKEAGAALSACCAIRGLPHPLRRHWFSMLINTPSAAEPCCFISWIE